MPRAPPRGVFVSRANRGEGRRPMAGRKGCESACYDHAQQRSLYRHALNALLLASRAGCDSEMARELVVRCAAMLRADDGGQEELVVERRGSRWAARRRLGGRP